MQIRGQFSDFFFETMLPALNAKIWQNFKAKKPICKMVIGSGTTTRSIEQYSQMAGVGLPGEIQEGEDVGVDSFVQGYSKTFRPLKYGLGIACTQELVEDDKVGIVSRRAVALSNSIAQAREIQAASVYNNAFDVTNYPGPDAVALCSASHPLVKAGGVQSNILSVAADLDVASLELALLDWELIKSHEGFLQNLPTPRLLVATANRYNAFQIVRAGQRSETANNTVNAFENGENGQAVGGPLVWAYLTDPDAWFLVAPPDETETLWLDRKAPYTKSDYIEKNETGYVYMRYRATVGFYGWKGVYGTPGA
jgi:hypothetical protein